MSLLLTTTQMLIMMMIHANIPLSWVAHSQQLVTIINLLLKMMDHVPFVTQNMEIAYVMPITIVMIIGIGMLIYLGVK